MGSEIGQRPRRAGRCANHNDLAWLYDDGSITCMDCLIVETSSTYCVWEPMPKEWTRD